MCYIFYGKSSDEDMRFGHASQRGTHFGERVLYAYRFDTTSEPYGGNAIPGAPVNASMSDGPGRNQGGTVEYFVSHP